MVWLIKVLSALASAFVLSVLFKLLPEEPIYFIAYLLCVIYFSDNVFMHYYAKYISWKQLKQAERIVIPIDEIINKIKDEEDEDE
jgi:hypothetical protein